MIDAAVPLVPPDDVADAVIIDVAHAGNRPATVRRNTCVHYYFDRKSIQILSRRAVHRPYLYPTRRGAEPEEVKIVVSSEFYCASDDPTRLCVEDDLQVA